MTLLNLIKKVYFKIYTKIIYVLFVYLRVVKYKILSNCKNIYGNAQIIQPVLFYGDGAIKFGKNVKIGLKNSSNYFNGYGYIEARDSKSTISIGNNVWINNNVSIVSEGEGIDIGDNSLIGVNVEILDSDFHDLDPNKRLTGKAKTKKVEIGENVFIGSNAKILKGVKIGKNSVIANSSVVVKDIPENVVVGGNPAKVIKEL